MLHWMTGQSESILIDRTRDATHQLYDIAINAVIKFGLKGKLFDNKMVLQSYQLLFPHFDSEDFSFPYSVSM